MFLTSTVGGIGLQYLWVCSGKEGHGQATLISLHSSQPQIARSFKGRSFSSAYTCGVLGKFCMLNSLEVIGNSFIESVFLVLLLLVSMGQNIGYRHQY